MGKEYDVTVDRHKESLDVIIPRKYMEVFTRYFNDEFSYYNSTKIGESSGRISSYHSHPKGCRVVVRIQEYEEKRFDKFLDMFCRQKGLSLQV